MTLVDLVDKDIIKVPITSKDKVDILKELVDVLDKAGKVKDPDQAVDDLIARENQGSTGLEQGIAVPHAKTDSVDSITVSIGVSPGGVDFEAMDGEPSYIFFLMLAPPNQPGQHVEILSEIARLCQSPAVLKSLKTAGSADDVLELFEE